MEREATAGTDGRTILSGGGLAALAAVALLAAALLPAGTARAQETRDALAEPGVEIMVANERPLRGQPVRVTVLEGGQPLAGARVVAVYRPNSNTQHREELAAVDSSGLLLWTPTDAGPVTLEVRDAGTPADADEPPMAAITVAVRFGSFPPSGLFIMVLAGILLFGGAATGMYLLMRPTEHMPAEEPPST